MFTQLQLTNFKSFAGESAPIPLAPVTILVGANGSGKSNFLDAFRFLQGIGRGLSISEILTGKFEGGNKVFEGLRGGFAEVCWRGTEQFAIESCQRIRADQIDLDVPLRESVSANHVIESDIAGMPRVTMETLTVDENEQFLVGKGNIRIRTDEPGHVLLDHQDRSIPANGHYATFFESAKSVLAQFGLIPPGSWDAAAEFSRTVSRKYAASRFLDITPSAMRGFISPKVPELGEHGENLSAIVHQICADSDRKRQFLDWLSELCAPHVYDIDFARNDLLEVLVQLVEGNGEKRKISARSISDGTLRFMGLLAAMYSAPEGSLFLLEEIENGLHPTRVHLLVELFEQFAEARNLQIIATTHSSQVLLALSRAALECAILFARDEDSPGTVTRRLGDLEDFDDVTQRSKIDYLFTTGWLERAL